MLKLLLLACLTAATFGGTIPENVGIEGYIVGGRSTNISEVPYQVSLHDNGDFICGGSIVSPTIIVTAAHCVHNLETMKASIRAGSSRTDKGGVVVGVKKKWYHSKFRYNTIDYDVGILELDRPLNFSDTIKPIKLATSEPIDGSRAIISGWGTLREFGPFPDTLQSVVVPVVLRATCEFNYADYYKITPRMICAGVEGKDSCQGDSGGPLNVNGELAGIVSFGKGCARKGYPGVYANVADPEITAFIRKYAKI